jgi:hypothetical protein
MAAKPGNQYWRNRKFEQALEQVKYLPHELFNAFIEYTDWVEHNPIIKKMLLQKTGEITDVPVARPMSIRAFMLYCGCAEDRFYYYNAKFEYKEICKIIRDAIFTQKFELAIVGVYNAPFVAMDLGMSNSVVHVIEDRRRTVAELFPEELVIDAQLVEGSDKMLNERNCEVDEIKGEMGMERLGLCAEQNSIAELPEASDSDPKRSMTI